MAISDALDFLLSVFRSLQDVGARIVDFLATSPFPALFPDWTWGGIMFGTGVFAFFAWAVVTWLAP